MTTTQTHHTHTATMTSTAGTVTVAVTAPNGDTLQTFTTKETGKFLTRLDKMMTTAGYARTGYTATDGALVAAVRNYNGI